jgi:hypothetical protein
MFIVSTQILANPEPKGWRTAADINHYIKDFPHHSPHQLTLGLLDLIMKTSQHPLGGTGIVILNKIKIEPCLFKKELTIEALHEKTTIILENPRLNHQNIGDLCGTNNH